MSRAQQQYVPGLGAHFTSPKKRRAAAHNRQPVIVPGRRKREEQLRAQLLRLDATDPTSLGSSTDETPPVLTQEDSAEWVDIEMDSSQIHDFISPEQEEIDNIPIDTQKKPKRVVPNDDSRKLYHRWQMLLPKLIQPLLRYGAETAGRPASHEYPGSSKCEEHCSSQRSERVLCLFWDHFEYRNISSCSCCSLPERLVSQGLFTTSPTQPRMSVSIDLLEFYYAIFERSGDAVTAIAAALRNFYARRGWHMLDTKGQPIRDPFRRGLGYAIQWYDTLRVRVNRDVESAVDEAREHIQSHVVMDEARDSQVPHQDVSSQLSGVAVNDAIAAIFPVEANVSKNPPVHASPTPLFRGQCATLLQRRCPACFGGVLYGRTASEGGDIQVCVDGNFSQRHLRSAGDSPSFYDPEYFISKSQVDAVGNHIDSQRKKPPKKTYVPKVPDEAVDSCERGHEAADEHKTKTNGDVFDDTGVMALVCRHDIPLFLTNIDTPGEQQKYAIALIIHLFSFLPPEAVVAALYDVGCVADRSVSLYDLLPQSITSRLLWATSVMHAYGHEWSCQLVYNPRLREGLGLTDGEGVERLWSKLRKLIALTRTSARSRRIWLIDRQASAIGNELRDDLGDFISRRLRRGVQQQGEDAQRDLQDCRIPVEELREQWHLQRQAQLSVRAHAPARLKRELDVVFALQSDIDNLERALSTAKGSLLQSDASPSSLVMLEKLKQTHMKLVSRAEELYASLNIHDSFPDLEGVDYEFVRMLLLARDLKINIRKRAIASFLEWDRLDQAVGGRDNPLGTKLHQRTRKTMTKRKPALLAALRKFNKYCDMLANLNKSQWGIPSPQKLSTDLSLLRDDPILMHDIWITPSINQQAPRWLEDVNVRKGIRAMLKLDRCLEERRRLGREADNLCRWYGSELAALELALLSSQNVNIVPLLRQRLYNTRLLQLRWSNPLTSAQNFDSQARSSVEVALRLSGQPIPAEFCWLQPQILASDVHLTETEESEDDMDLENILGVSELVAEESSQQVLADALADETEDDRPEDVEIFPPLTELTLVWQSLPGMRFDLFPELAGLLPPNIRTIGLARHRPSLGHFDRLYFSPQDMARLNDPKSCLNDENMNGCAALLHTQFALPDGLCYAVFSTYDLALVRDQASDEALWRSVRHRRYWEKDLWLVPIYRSGRYGSVGHWALAIVNPRSCYIFHFDSLAAESLWRNDMKDIFQMISRLSQAAKMDLPFSGWNCRPILTRPVQNNSYDCGVWVLACMAAVFRGFDASGLRESDMPKFRQYLLSLVLMLSSSQ